MYTGSTFGGPLSSGEDRVEDDTCTSQSNRHNRLRPLSTRLVTLPLLACCRSRCTISALALSWSLASCYIADTAAEKKQVSPCQLGGRGRGASVRGLRNSQPYRRGLAHRRIVVDLRDH